MMKKILILSLFLLPIFLLRGQAPFKHMPIENQEKNHKTVRFLLDLGIAYGGDEILNVQFTNGSTQSVKAGQGGIIGAGFSISPKSISALSLKTTLGIKANTTAADNANIYFIRYPFNAMLAYSISPSIILTAGITKHLGPKLKGDGFLPDQSYESNLGYRAELSYKAFYLAYEQIKYNQNMEFNGGSVGLGYQHLF